MKKLSSLLGILALLLLLQNCTEEPQTIEAIEEQVESSEHTHPERVYLPENIYKNETLSLDELPDLKDDLESKLGKSFLEEGGETSKKKSVVLDKNSIVKTEDEYGNVNYSVIFYVKDAPANTFYNLIVNKSKNGKSKKPFVLGYTVDDSAMDGFLNGSTEDGWDYSRFTGQIHHYPYELFFADGEYARTDCPPMFDEFGDPITCVDLQMTDGSSGSGGGSQSPGSTTEYGYYINVYHQIPDGRIFQFTAGSTCHWPGLCAIFLVYVPTETRKGSVALDDCPGCDVYPPGGIGVNFDSEVAIVAFKLQLDYTQKVTLNGFPRLAEKINNYLDAEGQSPEALAVAKEMVNALMDGSVVDFEEMFIETATPDDNYIYQGSKSLISNPLVLANGDQISVTFGTTKSDNLSANQNVSTDLIDGIKFAIEEANKNLSSSNKITSIHIHCTTNGKHSATSNHSKATAVDISRINGAKMILTGVNNQIRELQKAMDKFTFVRENFGPYFKHKFSKELPVGQRWNYNHPVSGHKDHIHFSIRK